MLTETRMGSRMQKRKIRTGRYVALSGGGIGKKGDMPEARSRNCVSVHGQYLISSSWQTGSLHLSMLNLDRSQMLAIQQTR